MTDLIYGQSTIIFVSFFVMVYLKLRLDSEILSCVSMDGQMVQN